MPNCLLYSQQQNGFFHHHLYSASRRRSLSSWETREVLVPLSVTSRSQRVTANCCVISGLTNSVTRPSRAQPGHRLQAQLHRLLGPATRILPYPSPRPAWGIVKPASGGSESCPKGPVSGCRVRLTPRLHHVFPPGLRTACERRKDGEGGRGGAFYFLPGASLEI